MAKPNTSQGDGGETIVIKKYANRRLYDTERSAYITLEDLAGLVREGREFRVVDAKSGEDLTRAVLTQIIVEAEGKGQTMLPVDFLRGLIGMYGDTMQDAIPQYLDAAMASFRDNRAKMQDAWGQAIEANPFADIAKRNMEMFGGAFRAFGMTNPAEADAAPDPRDTEIVALKAEIAALKKAGAKNTSKGKPKK